MSPCPRRHVVRSRQRGATVIRSAHSHHRASPRASALPENAWHDDFSNLDDREDLPPLPLPRVSTPKRIVLVRHGQSTWNACGRMQGSSDFSELTEKGRNQAQTTALLLETENFDAVYSSPLRRATETANIVCGERRMQLRLLPGLREIDLYSFQGLLKDEAREAMPAEYRMWKESAENFDIDGHAPVRELWRRASRVWNDLLTRDHRLRRDDDADDDTHPENILVVAHNAVNQALIGTALGLKPSHFRRLVQSNAAATVLSVFPTAHGPLTVLDGLNETPEIPLHASPGARVVLVCDGSSSADALKSRAMPTRDGALSEARATVTATAEMLREFGVQHVLSSPMARARHSADTIAESVGIGAAGVEVVPCLRDPLSRQEETAPASSSAASPPPPPSSSSHDAAETSTIPSMGDEPMQNVWKRGGQAWASALGRIGDRGTAVLVGHPVVASAMLCRCLALPPEFVPRINLSDGSVSIVSFPEGALGGPGILQCANYTKHLEPGWAVPVSSKASEQMVMPSASAALDGF